MEYGSLTGGVGDGGGGGFAVVVAGVVEGVGVVVDVVGGGEVGFGVVVVVGGVVDVVIGAGVVVVVVVGTGGTVVFCDTSFYFDHKSDKMKKNWINGKTYGFR